MDERKRKIHELYSQSGISFGEVILVVLLMSILAIIIVPRFLNVTTDAKYNACITNVSNINALVQLFYIKENTWPSSDLSDIGANISYFPSGLPDCPVTEGAAYTLDETIHRVSGHLRGDPTHP